MTKATMTLIRWCTRRDNNHFLVSRHWGDLSIHKVRAEQLAAPPPHNLTEPSSPSRPKLLIECAHF